jgi:hypothetical protein
MIVPYLIRKYDYRAIKKQYDFQIDNWYILLADDSEVINDDNAIEQVQWFNKQE